MKLIIVSCLLLAGIVYADESTIPVEVQPDTTDYQGCFEKDSISCIQVAMFRKAKEFFGKQSIDLVGGLSLIKATDRSGKSLDEPNVDIETANTVEGREGIIEDYLLDQARNFFQQRSLNFDFVSATRSISNAIPDDIKASVRSLVVEEGRGKKKKKKLIKKLLPLLGLLKIKLAALGVLSLFGIVFMAKKALLTSLIALALSGFMLIQKLMQAKQGGGGGGGHAEEIIAYNTGGWSSSGGGSGGSGGGWNSGYGDSGWGEHGSHSQPIPQLAYAGHQKSRR